MDVGLDAVGIEHVYVPRTILEGAFLALLVAGAFGGVQRLVGLYAAILVAGLVLGAYALVGDLSLSVAVVVAVIGALAWRRSGRPLADRTHRRAGLEIFAVLAAYVVYEMARIHTEGTYETAYANALHVIDFERSLGLFFERSLQAPFLEAEPVLRAISFVYSYSFLAWISGVMLWLFLVDDANFRLMRNALGVSCVLAVGTMWLFPTAPPRLVPEVDIIDSVVWLGREHDFANEYAAIPSLHVGWTALSGYVLGRSIGGRAGLAIMPIPGAIMALAVVVTGNHWWVDGVIGAAYTLGPALAFVYAPRLVPPQWRAAIRRGVAAAPAGTVRAVRTNQRAQFSILGLGGLLTYMFVAQYLNPGFTDHWGYLVAQMAFTLSLLVAGEVLFEREGGLAWQTHLIAVCTTYADTLGTDGNLYARFSEYDKIVHFFGTAAVTSAAYDCLRAINIRRGYPWEVRDRAKYAVYIGISLGVAWEVYELIGDKVFESARIGGVWDTANDLVSDTVGALVAAAVLYRGELATEDVPSGST